MDDILRPTAAGKGASRAPRSGIRRPSLHDEIVKIVRRMILEGVLAPGTRISEAALCDELGVSRTPLREALKVLASEELVELTPNRGAWVTEITVEHVADMFEMMGALENLAGRLVASRAADEEVAELQDMHRRMVEHHREGRRQEYFDLNQAIHLQIVEYADNSVLAAAYADYAGKIKRVRYLANLFQARWDESVREHEEIIAALVARDGHNLGGILQEHSRRTGEVVIQAVKQSNALADTCDVTQKSG